MIVKKTFRRYHFANPLREECLYGDSAMLRAFNPAAASDKGNVGWVDPWPGKWVDEKPRSVMVKNGRLAFMLLRVDRRTAPSSRLVRIELQKQIRLWKETNDDQSLSRDDLATLRDKAREILDDQVLPRVGLHPVTIDLDAGEAWLYTPTEHACKAFEEIFAATFQVAVSPAPVGGLRTTPESLLTDLWRAADKGGRLEPPDEEDKVIRRAKSFLITLGPTAEVLLPESDSTLKVKEATENVLEMCGNAIDNGGTVTAVEVALARNMTPLGMAGLSARKGLSTVSVSIDDIPSGLPWDEKEAVIVSKTRECLDALDAVIEGLDRLNHLWRQEDEEDGEAVEKMLEQARKAVLAEEPPISDAIM